MSELLTEIDTTAEMSELLTEITPHDPTGKRHWMDREQLDTRRLCISKCVSNSEQRCLVRSSTHVTK